MEVSLMRWLLVLLRLRFEISAVFFLWRLRRGGVSLYVFVSTPALAMLRAMLGRLPKGNFVIPGVQTACRWLAITANRRYFIHRLLWRKSSAVLSFLHCCIRFTISRTRNMRHERAEGQQFLWKPSVAALVSRSFAICASNVSPITSFRNRFRIPWSTTLYTTDQILLCMLWNSILGMSSNDSSTKVVNSDVINSLTADL